MTPAERRIAALEAGADRAERSAALTARIEADREARFEADAAAAVEGLTEKEREVLAFVVLPRLPVHVYAALIDDPDPEATDCISVALAMAHHPPLLYGMTRAAGFDTLADVGKLLAAQVAEYRSTAERAGVSAEAMPTLVAIATCDRVPLSELLEEASPKDGQHE